MDSHLWLWQFVTPPSYLANFSQMAFSLAWPPSFSFLLRCLPELTFSPNLGKTIWDKVGKIFLATILQVIVLLFLTLFPVVLMEEARDVHIRSRALSPSFSRRRKNDNKSIRKTGNYGFSSQTLYISTLTVFLLDQKLEKIWLRGQKI